MPLISTCLKIWLEYGCGVGTVQRRRVGGGWVRLMCMERLKAFLVWLIGWLRSDRMRDCRFNPQLVGHVCSRSFLLCTPFFFPSSSLLLSLLPPSLLMHAYVVLKVSLSGEPFSPFLIYFLLRFSWLPPACPLLQPCSEIRWLFSDVLSHHCTLSLYGHIIFGETGRGWKKAANISASSPWTHSSCVYVCVRVCARVQKREQGRQRETASSHGDT